MKKMIYALRFMTVLPIQWKENEELRDVARSIALFPSVGLIIGIFLALGSFLSALLWSPLTGAVIITVLWACLTGALHLDGLSDTADGIWGGTSPERRLKIMKDSRTGVFGVVTLICFLLLKVSMIYELMTWGGIIAYGALIAAPVCGRWILVLLISTFPSARENGMGSFFRKHTRGKEKIGALVSAVLLILMASGFPGVILAFAVSLLAMAGGLFLKKKLNGLTGDTYGALCEVTELLFIALIPIMTSLFPERIAYLPLLLTDLISGVM
jgi:adenosylcobinamide-GDP ribazoletransferase